MTAELIAAQRAESAVNGNGNGNGSGNGSDSGGEPTPWRSSPSRPGEGAPADPYEGGDDDIAPAAQAELRSVGAGESVTDGDPADTAPPIDERADDIASLRSRLARTAAKKKSRASMDRPRQP
jgi:hypothetical protein